MMMISVFMPGNRLRFRYVNHRGQDELRDVVFRGLDYGSNEWYPDKQWFMRCYDVERDAYRSFALARIEGDAIEVVAGGLVDLVEGLTSPARPSPDLVKAAHDLVTAPWPSKLGDAI